MWYCWGYLDILFWNCTYLMRLLLWNAFLNQLCLFKKFYILRKSLSEADDILYQHGFILLSHAAKHTLTSSRVQSFLKQVTVSLRNISHRVCSSAWRWGSFFSLSDCYTWIEFEDITTATQCSSNYSSCWNVTHAFGKKSHVDLNCLSFLNDKSYDDAVQSVPSSIWQQFESVLTQNIIGFMNRFTSNINGFKRKTQFQ